MVYLDKILVDDDVLVVMERPIIISDHKKDHLIHDRLLFATAGYKNKILVGTEYEYSYGQMQVFDPEEITNYYLTTYVSNIKFGIHIVIEEGNVYAYAGVDIPWHITPSQIKANSTNSITPKFKENILFTQIEMKLLNKLKEEAYQIDLKKIKDKNEEDVKKN